ncbi:MAG: helix-turn-helix domain-containing protein [Firmicutes bacterium]|nr:helix-turn-helix domain-containing protein [Bacillota bacterium]
MIKLMVADLEIDNVSNFKSYIRKHFSVFDVIRPALSIRELYKNITNNMPDIVLMEVRFFGPNAVQSIKEFHDDYPNIKIILYGNITEGEYMKKCLDFGGITYMYRPVKPRELDRCLKEAVAIFEKEKLIDEQQQELMRKYEGQLLMFETQFLTTLIKGHMKNEGELEGSLDYFDIRIDKPYVVANLRIDHFKKIVLALDEKEKHLVIFQMLNIVNDKIENGKAFINGFNEIVMIIGECGELDDTIAFLTEIKREVKEKSNLNVSIGISRIYQLFSDIQTAYEEAEAALRYRCLIGYNSIIPIDYVEPENKITYSYPRERETLLVYTAVIGEFDYCKKLLKELFNALEKASPLPKNLLGQIIMDILISINRNAAEQGIDIGGINEFFNTREILGFQDCEAARIYMEKGLENLCRRVRKIRKDREDTIYKDAIDYISVSYAQQLTAAKVASEMNCSAEYFKKIMLENGKMTFTEYLNKVRIDNAVKLIMKTNMTDDMIAVSVGINDINVFKALFKQQMGYLIGDYRYIKNRILK